MMERGVLEEQEGSSSSLSGSDCTLEASLSKDIIYLEVSVLIIIIVFYTSIIEFCKNLVLIHNYGWLETYRLQPTSLQADCSVLW